MTYGCCKVLDMIACMLLISESSVSGAF